MTKTLYLHDGGEITCVEHAPFSLKSLLEENPRKKLYWTPRGTWEKADAQYATYFKQQTNMDLECESCEEEAN